AGHRRGRGCRRAGRGRSAEGRRLSGPRLAGRHHRQPAAARRPLRRRPAGLRPAGGRAGPGPARHRIPAYPPRRPGLRGSRGAAFPPRRTPLASMPPSPPAKGLDVSAAAHPLTDEPTLPSRRPQLEVVDRSSTGALARAERAVADLLAALGQDRSSAHLADTPRRVAASFAELLTPAPFTLTTFPNDEGYDELVLARA